MSNIDLGNLTNLGDLNLGDLTPEIDPDFGLDTSATDSIDLNSISRIEAQEIIDASRRDRDENDPYRTDIAQDNYNRWSDYLESLGVYDYDAPPWYNDFARASAEEFLNSSVQIIYQSIQDAALARLSLLQSDMLSQVQAGNDTITRPSLGSVEGGEIYQVFWEEFSGPMNTYLDNLFGDADSITREELLDNPEFVQTGIYLASSSMTNPSGEVTWSTTDQDQVDTYTNLYETRQTEIAQQEADAAAEEERQRQVAIENAGTVFSDLGYNATQEEKEQFADNPDGIADYVNPRQVTAEEAAEIFQRTYGYEPNREEIEQFMGQGGEGFEASQQEAIGEYVDPRHISLEELEAIAEEQGYDLTPEDYENLIGQAEGEGYAGWGVVLNEDGTIKDYGMQGNVISEDFDRAVVKDEDELREIASNPDVGFDISDLSEEEIADLIGGMSEQEVADQLDPLGVSTKELGDIARQENFDLANLSEEELAQLVGNNKESDIIQDIDSRATTVGELQEVYKQRTGNELSVAEAQDMLDKAIEANDGTLTEEQFEEWVDETIETNFKVQLQNLGQNILDIIFGKDPATGASKTIQQIWEEQRELLFPPSPSDPDYERKYTEWLKRQVGSIISINHDPKEGIFAGVRFPVPIPVSGPEIIIPLFDEDGKYIGGNVAQVLLNEAGDIITETGERIGQMTGNVIQIFDAAGEVVHAIPLSDGGIDPTTGLPVLVPAGWEEGDANPWEVKDSNGDGVIDQQVDADGNPVDPDTGLPIQQEPEEEEEPPPDAEDIEEDAYDGVFNNDVDGDGIPNDQDEFPNDPNNGVDPDDTDEGTTDTGDDIPEGDRVAYLSDVEAAKEEVLDTLGDQLEALGLDVDEVKNILDGVQEQLDGVATSGDLDELRSSLEQTISDELGELGIDDIQGTLDAVNEDLDGLNTTLNDLSRAVGLPAREDDPNTEEDESRPATGIYAAIEEGDAATKEYIDGLVEDIEALGVDVANIPGLIEGIIESTSAELEALGLSQEEIINLLGSPATDDTEATGLYATIDDLSTQIDTTRTELNDRIDDLIEDGLSRADAVDQALADLAEANDTNTEAILEQIGTTEDALKEDIADVASDVEDLAGTVGQEAQYDEDGNLVSEATGIFADIDALIEQGASEYEALSAAVGNLSEQLGVTETEILDAISDSESRLSDQIGSPAVADDPDTEEDESQPATGIYADIAAAQTAITGDISDLTDLVMAYEAEGLSRDEALATAISDLSDQLGTTEETFLASLGETEETVLDAIAASEATITGDISDLTDLVMAYEADGIARDEAITLAVNDLSEDLGLTRDELLLRIGESETTIMDAIDASQMETDQYLDYISSVIGRPASELTQDDVDMVVDLLAEDEFISDFNNDLRLYDVNFDGQINQTDIGLLQGFVDAGVEGIGEIPATGIYADAARRQDEITGDLRDQAEETRELIGTEAEATRGLMSQQNLFNALLGSGDLMGRQVDVKTPDPVQLKYIYDFSDIFATPQQRGLFPSPYGAPQRQAAQQVAQQRGIMSGPLNLGGLQGRPGMAAGGKVDYDFTDEIMHIMSYGDS